jgi:hypothetical protein
LRGTDTESCPELPFIVVVSISQIPEMRRGERAPGTFLLGHDVIRIFSKLPSICRGLLQENTFSYSID